jgi:hypothetical protein
VLEILNLSAREFFGDFIKARQFFDGPWLELFNGLPFMLAVVRRWGSVALVGVHGSVLAILFTSFVSASSPTLALTLHTQYDSAQSLLSPRQR